MIHFEGKKTDKAREIAEIEDMSYLMAELAQFEIEEYNKKALKKKNEGTLLILDRITFADPSFYFIPAILPMYIVNIKEGESDESEGSDGSDKSNGSDREDKSENEEKDESEDSDYKNKSKKSGKTNKSIKSKSKKKKNDSDFSDSNEEQIITTKNKKSKK